MKKFLLICFIALPILALGQAKPELPFALGLDFNDAEYDGLPTQSKFAGSKFKELPLKVSLKKWCPIPGNQGKIGSCVGWSSCYAALTMLQAQKNNISDKQQITAQALSAMYVYNQVKKNEIFCDGGTRIPLVLDLLSRQGSCLHKEFNVSTCSILPPDTLKRKAQPNAIKDYLSLFQTTDESALKIQKTKQSLAEGKPVVIGMEIKYNFLDVKKDNPVWEPSKGLTMFAGGHAMCVIGYDEGKQAFELINSWGESWGDNGFGWVKYEDYGKYCKYGFQMFLKEESSTDHKISLNGDFDFKYLAEGAGLQFNSAPVVYNRQKNYYETTNKHWKKGQLFQLFVKNSKPDQYIYVFSIDAEQKANVHFPRNPEFGNSIDGFNETPLVSVTNAEIIIPTPESALSIAHEGSDWLVVLYSKYKIENLNPLLKKLERLNDMEKIPEVLEKVYNHRIVPEEKITYMPNKMSVSAPVAGDEIIPIILRVDSGTKPAIDEPEIIEIKEK